MKKLLFTEGLSNHTGHKLLNKPLMEIFTQKYEVHTLCLKDWYTVLSPDIIQHHYTDVKECRIKKLTKTFSAIHILKEIHKLDEKYDFDIIIMSAFSYWVTPLWSVYFQNHNRLWILHHEDLDLSRRYPYRLFFNVFVKKYIHLTLDPFIREGMADKYPDIAGRIFELIHPYRRRVWEDSSLWEEYRGKFLCISVGRGASDAFFEKIVRLEEKKKILEKNGIYLYLKSRQMEYRGKHIMISPQYLSEEEYNALIYRASVLFICYAENYRLRVSAQMLDGLSSYKYVIGNKIRVIEVFHERYPDICKVTVSASDFLKQLINLKQSSYSRKYFRHFFENHSDKKIIRQMEQIEKSIFPDRSQESL